MYRERCISASECMFVCVTVSAKQRFTWRLCLSKGFWVLVVQANIVTGECQDLLTRSHLTCQVCQWGFGSQLCPHTSPSSRLLTYTSTDSICPHPHPLPFFLGWGGRMALWLQRPCCCQNIIEYITKVSVRMWTPKMSLRNTV